MNDKDHRAESVVPPGAARAGASLDLLAGSERVAVAAGVLRRIRALARAEMSAEVCGVLVGQEAAGVTLIEELIEADGATKAGTHVTFTQAAWSHIYSVKDRDFPDRRIVGWYHSHPGFGIFLSRQDLFIHENFFSAPGQVAWVYDPHSDEEGCFSWDGGVVKRLRSIRVIETACDDSPESVADLVPVESDAAADEPEPRVSSMGQGADQRKARKSSLTRRLFLLLALGVMFVAGVAAGLMLLPRTIIMYSLPDGRLLSPREVQAALDRARQRQKDQPRGTAAPAGKEPQPVTR